MIYLLIHISGHAESKSSKLIDKYSSWWWWHIRGYLLVFAGIFEIYCLVNMLPLEVCNLFVVRQILWDIIPAVKITSSICKPKDLQQPWYLICMTSSSLSSMMKDFNYLCDLSVMLRNEKKCKYIFMFLPNSSVCEGLCLLLVLLWIVNSVPHESSEV